MSDLIGDYARVLDLLGAQLDVVTPDELQLDTPCAKWKLAKIVGHVLGAIRYYAALAREGEVHLKEVMVPVDRDDDAAALFAVDAHDGLAAWSAPGALDRPVQMRLGDMTGADALEIHVADLAVHTWDVAAARGRPLELPADLAERALATWKAVIGQHDVRGIVFADEVPVGNLATPTGRLVAFTGRSPSGDRPPHASGRDA
jgi:uncharacterized protein (TIGR03086 family)